MATVEIWPYVFVKPGPKFTDSDAVKLNYSEMSAVSINLEDYPEGNEMLGFIAYFTGPLSNTSPINVRASFYNDATNKLLWSGEFNVPTPASQDYEWWNWYKVKFWIGHASWEINQAMKVRMEVKISGGGFPTTNKTLYQEVKSKLPPVPEIRVIEGYVKDELGKSKGSATITFGSKYTQSRSTDGYYGLIDPDKISGPIKCELPGYETQTKMITAPETGKMTINWILKAVEIPPAEIPWYTKWLNLTEEDVKAWRIYDVIGTIGLMAKMIDQFFPEEWTKHKLTIPSWFQEIELWLFFAPAFTTAVEGMIKAGATPAEANSITQLIKDKSFIKALDTMKANPLKYADDFRSLDPALASQILKGMSKDQLAKLATNVFRASWDEGLIATAPLWRRIMFAATKHKWTGALGLISLAGSIMGLDVWGNWSIVDNLQFMSGRDTDDLKDAFYDGTMSKEDALKELNMLLTIVKTGETKVKTSAGWNVLQIIFAPLWDDLAALTVDKIERAIEEIEGVVIPIKKGTLKVSPTPADSKVSVSGEIPTTGTFEAELDVGTYSVVVSKFGYTSQSKDLEVLENKTTSWNPELAEEVKPPALKAKLVIDVQPDGAIISVSGHPEITKEGEYFLDPGSYTIDFSLEGYKSVRRTVYLEEAEVEIVSVALEEIVIPPPEIPLVKQGTLNLVFSPADASVEIAAYPEITIAGTYVLDEGSYSIRVFKEGYSEQTRTAFIKENVTTTISISLTPLAPPPEELATLTIKSEPTNADIYIDGVYTFTKTPYTTKLEEGTYIIRAQLKDYYPYEVSVVLVPGDLGEITLPLTKIPSAEVPPAPYVPWETYYPEYQVPGAPQIEVQPAPYTTLPTPAYNLLDEATYFYEPSIDVQAPYTKELIVNIETTDVLPFKGRIYSIAFLDLTDPEQMPKVITSDDEKDVLNTFLDFFDAGGFTKIIGYNVSFDHRFIFTKAALYRRQAQRWAKVEMRDVMQILQQVKEAFVYGFNKAGTLDQWGKELLGYGKYGSQEECLARFIRKDFDYVDAFNINQVDLVYDLYALLRFTLSEAQMAQSQPQEALQSSQAIPEYPSSSSLPQKKKCPNCYQENELTATTCIVCGAAI